MGDWELFNILPGLAIVGIVLWLGFRGGPRTPEVADGPPDEPYRVYTREYDLELHSHDVAARLPDASDDYWKGYSDTYGTRWREARELAAGYAEALQHSSRPLQKVSKADGLGVVFLIDQSGSMRGAPMAAVAAAMRFVTSTLVEAEIAFEILGYSTAGWHGGRAYKKWESDGRPPRPGRLCSLLHIIYKSIDEPQWTDESQDAMLNPDILRENIDGEAIEWGHSRLSGLEASQKILIVVSDGASVDDATLMHNGPSYLERHLLSVISSVGDRSDVKLGALGIGHDVSRYYPYARRCDPESVTEALGALVNDLLSGQPYSPPQPFTSPSPISK